MKYFLIAGEASGDLHGANLMAGIKKEDAEAEFSFFGGDLMLAQGGRLLKHYREMAFMGFIPVLLNLRTILANMKFCKQAIVDYKPDVVILIDYPGFNLDIAKFVKTKTDIAVHYYISPKVWAWKEYRVKSFKKYVDEMFCILPFEVDFFKKHSYKVNYVGNPTVDAIADYRAESKDDSLDRFISENNLEHDKPIIAILAGSRKQEIKDNLQTMIASAKDFADYQLVIAGAPSITAEYYAEFKDPSVKIIFGQTYRLLSFAQLALVTSGTATLETALFRVPQVVCYKTPVPSLTYFVFKNFMTTKYISLVNLIANQTVVQELFAKFFSFNNIRKEASRLLFDADYRNTMLAEYDRIINILGAPGASAEAAHLIVSKLRERKHE